MRIDECIGLETIGGACDWSNLSLFGGSIVMSQSSFWVISPQSSFCFEVVVHDVR